MIRGWKWYLVLRDKRLYEEVLKGNFEKKKNDYVMKGGVRLMRVEIKKVWRW